jgi:hypothetical protein
VQARVHTVLVRVADIDLAQDNLQNSLKGQSIANFHCCSKPRNERNIYHFELEVPSTCTAITGAVPSTQVSPRRIDNGICALPITRCPLYLQCSYYHVLRNSVKILKMTWFKRQRHALHLIGSRQRAEVTVLPVCIQICGLQNCLRQ